VIKIAPSILSADFRCLREQIELVQEAGADWIHLDIMDGHFVPNITFGPMVVQAVRRITPLPLDVHLMIENPDFYLKDFQRSGADIITVHVEACRHLDRTLHSIKDMNLKAGVALNPATPLSSIEEVWEGIDLLLIMTVNPGFGGQKFIRSTLRKIEKAAAEIRRRGLDIHLEVDGGIDEHTAGDVVKAGAGVLVAGAAIFESQDIVGSLRGIREAAR